MPALPPMPVQEIAHAKACRKSLSSLKYPFAERRFDPLVGLIMPYRKKFRVSHSHSLFQAQPTVQAENGKIITGKRLFVRICG
jgi:hypothetical protein